MVLRLMLEQGSIAWITSGIIHGGSHIPTTQERVVLSPPVIQNPYG